MLSRGYADWCATGPFRAWRRCSIRQISCGTLGVSRRRNRARSADLSPLQSRSSIAWFITSAGIGKTVPVHAKTFGVDVSAKLQKPRGKAQSTLFAARGSAPILAHGRGVRDVASTAPRANAIRCRTMMRLTSAEALGTRSDRMASARRQRRLSSGMVRRRELEWLGYGRSELHTGAAVRLDVPELGCRATGIQPRARGGGGRPCSWRRRAERWGKSRASAARALCRPNAGAGHRRFRTLPCAPR